MAMTNLIERNIIITSHTLMVGDEGRHMPPAEGGGGCFGVVGGRCTRDATRLLSYDWHYDFHCFCFEKCTQTEAAGCQQQPKQPKQQQQQVLFPSPMTEHETGKSIHKCSS